MLAAATRAVLAVFWTLVLLGAAFLVVLTAPVLAVDLGAEEVLGLTAAAVVDLALGVAADFGSGTGGASKMFSAPGVACMLHFQTLSINDQLWPVAALP